MAETSDQSVFINPEEEEDIFSAALNVESTAYQTGYDQGVADGARAGRIEGRIFGLTHGYDRFCELGRLRGRAEIWSSRLSDSKYETLNLENNPRIAKHIDTLLELTDPQNSPAVNTEEAVEAFEERLKRAKAKVKLVEKILGEEVEDADTGTSERRTETGGVRLVTPRDATAERNIEEL